MTPYPNIPRRVAHLLAMLMVRDDPSIPKEEFPFESVELDIGDNEIVVITYERMLKQNHKRKPKTLPVFQAVSVTPGLSYT